MKVSDIIYPTLHDELIHLESIKFVLQHKLNLNSTKIVQWRDAGLIKQKRIVDGVTGYTPVCTMKRVSHDIYFLVLDSYLKAHPSFRNDVVHTIKVRERLADRIYNISTRIQQIHQLISLNNQSQRM